MAKIQQFEEIHGVEIAQLKIWGDERGKFMESFRKEWFPQRKWERIQSNRSYSKAGVLRGLHYHHQQVDYWFLSDGKIRVGLADLRPASPTYLQSATLDIDATQPIGLFIPIGVAHGFLALTDSILNYTVDNYYTGKDEFGVAWNDPQLSVPWQVESPLLSSRDQQNPPLADIPPDILPQ